MRVIPEALPRNRWPAASIVRANRSSCSTSAPSWATSVTVRATDHAVDGDVSPGIAQIGGRGTGCSCS